MQRDKRGRFIKKAETGTKLDLTTPLLVNKGLYSYRVKPDAATAFAEYKKVNPTYASSISDWLTSDAGKDYIEPMYSDGVERVGFDVEIPELPFFTVQTPVRPQIQRTFGSTPRQMQMQALQQNYLPEGTIGSPKKISYTIQDGKKIDQWGQEIPDSEFIMNHQYFEYSPEIFKSDIRDPSVGRNFVDPEEDKKPPTLNKEHLANMLELVKAGIGVGINNKIAERAKKAEIPFLQNTSEFQRSVVGNYEAKLQGEKAAAQLRNLASRPLTSDGNAQQNIMLEAQLKGQQYIDQGNSQDNAAIRQSRETSWQQNKENTIQRQAAATANQQAMLMANKNKFNIDNMRDSNNFSQIINPYLSATEQRLRNSVAKQAYYEDHYNNAIVSAQVWGDKTIKLSPTQEHLRSLALMGGTALNDYIKDNETLQREWAQLSYIMKNEILRRQAASHGVILDIPSYYTSGSLSYDSPSTSIDYRKKGGTIYKAKLTKRTKDNDRAAKSIESSKKIAARFLEKAMDSLYTYDQVELIAKPKKKRKYQAGGGLPFVGFTPVFATSEVGAPEAAKTEPETSKTTNLTTKDVLELLKDMDGLPSDMAFIVNALQNFEMQKSTDPLGLSSSGIASQYISLINKIKVAKFNRDEYTQAFNQLKGNGGLNEFAVTSDGLLIGTNKDGDFKYFTPDQVNAGDPARDGYVLITNSNLLHIRANSPEGAFDHQLITFAQGGIGMETITKIVNDVVQGLGKSEKEESGFVQIGSEGSIKAGLQFLQKAVQEVGDSSVVHTMSVADYYQAGYLTEDQAQQANLALQYIMNTLPANARALLQVKGGSPEGGMALLSSIITAKTSTKTQFKATPKKMTNTGSGSSGSSGSGDVDGLKLSPVQMMQLGYTDHTEITLQKGTKYAVKVNAQVLPIYDVNKKGLGITTLDEVASSSFGGALDMNNVTMGGQLIDPHSMQNVQIDATNLYVMNLPIDKNSPDGTIKPDLAWLQKIEAIDQTIREQGITDVATINALYTEAGLPVLMDDNGQLNTRDYCKFGVLNGHALNTAFKDLDVLDDTVLEIEDEDQIENVMRIINAGKNEKDRIDFDSKGFWDFLPFTEHDSLFEGTVYIPIRTNPFTGMMGGGQYPTAETAAEVEALVQQKERTRGYVDPGLLTE